MNGGKCKVQESVVGPEESEPRMLLGTVALTDRVGVVRVAR